MRLVGSLKRQRLKILSVIFTLFLVIGCVFVLAGKNYFAFAFSLALPILVLMNFIGLIYLSFKKSKFVFFPTVGLILFFLIFDSFFQYNLFKEMSSEENSISILSYNVHGFSYIFNQSEKKSFDDREHKILNFVKEVIPDIIVYQEFHYTQLEDLRNDYPYYFLGYRKGVKKSLQIILSKFPIINKGYVDFPNTRNNAMYVDVKIENTLIRIYNLHLQSFGLRLNSNLYSEKGISKFLSSISNSQRKRIEQIHFVKEHIKDFKGKTIICGDFNSSQFSPTYLKLKKDKKDSFIEKGNGLGTTYNLKGYPLRLDYILVDKEIKVLTHKNFKLGFSDHEPILVDLNIK